ncbi:alternate-type signal peptide domain-containing protein [Cellulomonas sp. S1-8]|uniref:alternate-type signal peptide domain-containing protein n=1 Tax=Cellulomonas sp. S1-8 TaxID=2904790 RepID=UPI0022431A51|nr:alternate-type signal peptide domain-containing protein [Cellulomonas sp. S1-8]UZN02238.1 alternate-type signal peptide domain-containing protein [Cellulomonas sp. S1-8]
MKNKTKGLIAGVAGIALLTGGSTFALWTASSTVAGGTITNGNLAIAAVGTPGWKDVSTDRADRGTAGHDISLATWRMVPGDVAEGTYGFQVALEGDNLVANVGVDTTVGTLPTGMSVTYDVVSATGTVLANDIALGTDSAVRFAAPRAGQAAGAPANAAPTIVVDRTALATVNPTSNMTVVLTARFDAGTAATTSASATTALGSLVVNVNQVRTGTDFVVPPVVP